MLFRPILLVSLLLLQASPQAFAQRALDAVSYQDCLNLSRSRPEEAFATAQSWQATGGGLPAGHCAALALFELKHYGDAADRLEKLLPEAEAQAPHLVTDLVAQAANAWLLAGLADRARKLLDIAVAARPDALELRLDRAQALAELNDYAAAEADLDHVLHLAPTRDDAMALRAAARRLGNNPAGALEDAETALALNSRNVEALLERGYLRHAAGDRRGARADLIQVRLMAPDTPAAEAAAREIEAIDLGRN
ncbi:MAG: hypothetical protein KBB36_01610 [Ferrovibrio sp.]|nr:hypothetical protein [Ferrovibrio sp.]